MNRSLRITFSLALALAVGFAVQASAQSQAEFKRELKAGKDLYKEPGLMDVTVKSMRGMMMLTGNVATDAESKKAEEIIKAMRGVKEVRNRIRVGKVEECSAANDQTVMAKIDKEIENEGFVGSPAITIRRVPSPMRVSSAALPSISRPVTISPTSMSRMSTARTLKSRAM